MWKNPIVSPILERHGQRCSIRPWIYGDEDSLALHANDPQIAAWLADGFPNPYTRDAARAWIEVNRPKDPPESFAIIVDGEAVGCTGYIPKGGMRSCSVAFGYWLGVRYWGRGIVTEAASLTLAWMFEHLDIQRVQADVFEGNGASMRVLQKLGFVHEGTLRKALIREGRMLDNHLFGLLRDEWQASGR